jgi:hypothetical protein
VLLSEVLNYDFARKPIDKPFTDEELTEFSFQGFRDRVIRLSGKKESDGAGFHHRLWARHRQGASDVLRQREAGGRSDGGVVHRARLRRVRAGPETRTARSEIASYRALPVRKVPEGSLSSKGSAFS